ncbi:MAG: TfoX/Sxy family protein [Azonexus sp.]|jgi:DNA transformation protein|nr:TfoX/Sxy family protein [Betaproteobacteria bacterium]MBK8919576.1 TfoX/Sxy family protein [Betaproteobacteria bacterium]MBP6036343.1 TfoX/Sxy family protein [Azonexus sp.]MBP6906793.1 TfoX/Sxy family protein [Azonexus sp.]
MASREFAAYVVELLEPLGAVSARRMFGGYGLYREGLMFALIADDTLYVKADAENRGEYEKRAMPPFLYTRQGKTITIAYHAVPPEALDDRTDLLALARLGFAAALRGRKSVAGKKPG